MGRCGTIAIVGRPNVGKSTLLNRACGAHLSIVSPRPQTTRVQVRGVSTRGDDQIVFVDTPGYSTRMKALSRAMHARVVDAIGGSDVVLLVTDVFGAQRRALEEKGAAGAYVHPEDRRIAERISGGEGARSWRSTRSTSSGTATWRSRSWRRSRRFRAWPRSSPCLRGRA